jgi:hypothetical protein
MPRGSRTSTKEIRKSRSKTFITHFYISNQEQKKWILKWFRRQAGEQIKPKPLKRRFHNSKQKLAKMMKKSFVVSISSHKEEGKTDIHQIGFKL